MLCFFANDVVVLRCQGQLEGNRFLDGRTHDGTVGLVPNADPPFTGTGWRTHDAGGGNLFIQSLGHLPGNRFLDGRTHDGTVGLAPNTDFPFTGIRGRLSARSRISLSPLIFRATTVTG